MVAAAKLLRQLASGLPDAAAAPMTTLPVVRGLNVTVKVAVEFEASEATFHVTTLRHHEPPLALDKPLQVGAGTITR